MSSGRGRDQTRRLRYPASPDTTGEMRHPGRWPGSTGMTGRRPAQRIPSAAGAELLAGTSRRGRLETTRRKDHSVAYDEDLADRVRAVLPAEELVTERRMFGGLTFMLRGHMCCGIVGDTLMVRLGQGASDRALDHPHVRPMDFTGRPAKGMVFVEPGGLHGAELRAWIDAATAFVRTLPPKPVRKSR
jgi:TfoX N-terminal domain